MDRASIQAFVGRDWTAISAKKTAYWADRFREAGWRSTWTAADQLLADMRRLRPDFPTVRDRDEDLRGHLELRRALDAAADAFARRRSAR